MRLAVLIVAGALTACATPKQNPTAYWKDTYAPGQVIVESDGSFVSTASVYAKDDKEDGRLAAWKRVLDTAEQGGFTHFKPGEESEVQVLGLKVTISGRLYKGPAAGAYPISGISRLLVGLPIEEPRVAPVVRKQASIKPARKKIPAAPIVEEEEEEPLVIMAPEDITGSIRQGPEATAINAEIENRSLRALPEGIEEAEIPGATRGIPKGVILQRD